MRSWGPAARVSYEGLSVACGGSVYFGVREHGGGEERQKAVGTILLGGLTDKTSGRDPQMVLPPGAVKPGSQQSFSLKSNTKDLKPHSSR